jgi:hypothetical protein
LKRGLVIVSLVVAALVAVPAPAAQPLETAFLDPWSFRGSNGPAATWFERARGAGASYARLLLVWSSVAPASPPANPTDPDDPGYDWSQIDQQVTGAVAAGLKPIVYIYGAPTWAEGPGRPASVPAGAWKPSPAALADFAEAAATRYDGGSGMPRVRHWQIWNEPNRGYFLNPQMASGKPFAPLRYRLMVNAAAESIRTVPGNVVVAGGLAPYGDSVNGHLAPLPFMRAMLCMSKRRPARPVCDNKSSFDRWAHHAYACGGPTRHAYSPDNVAVADLPEMGALLRAAVRFNRVVHRGPVGFWITEVAQDTKPPDRKGVGLRLHARWVAEALYRMWSAGVSLATWFPIRDRPLPDEHYQAGLYFANGNPKKLSLRAFLFPFAAYRRPGKIVVWGRTPPGARNRIVYIDRQTSSGGWFRAGTDRAGAAGIFSRTFRASTRRPFRARVRLDGGGTLISIPFALRRPRYPYVCAFGVQ